MAKAFQVIKEEFISLAMHVVTHTQQPTILIKLTYKHYQALCHIALRYHDMAVLLGCKIFGSKLTINNLYACVII